MEVKISLMLTFLILIASCTKIVENPVLDPEIMDLTEQECSKAQGHWNECGSPCLGTDADYCIEVCEAHCECGGIAGFGCPKGYSCWLTGQIADEMGVCVKG